MKWHDYTTLQQIVGATDPAARKASRTQWYRESLPTMGDRFLRAQAVAEDRWLQDRRPYYSVYPVIVPSLLGLSLDLDSGLIHLPLPVLFVRFAAGREVAVPGGRKIRSIFAARIDQIEGRDRGIGLWVDFGERSPQRNCPIYSYRVFPLTAGVTLEEGLRVIDHIETDTTSQESDADLLPAVRLVCTLCLLHEDDGLVERDVLTDDQAKYDASGDEKYVSKAERRGKRGWSVGRRIPEDVGTHIRKAHLALRWTGVGRHVPRIVPIKATWVQRRKLAQVPTGYMDDLRCKLCGQVVTSERQVDECSACREANNAIGATTDMAGEGRVQKFGDDSDRHRSGIGRDKISGG